MDDESSLQDNKNTLIYYVVKDLFFFLQSLFLYLYLRLRQTIFYSWALALCLIFIGSEIKQAVVRRMFWGRSSFYRSAFQFSVGLMTIIMGISGLAGRLNLFASSDHAVLAYPTELLGDADYLDESASIKAIVTKTTLNRGFDVQKYIVQKGDSLESIANRFEISSDTIRWANDITGDFLRIGQELEILPINGVAHIVESGDTISSIAEEFEASEQDIYDINWLESDILKVGQELLVPNGSLPQPTPVVQPIVASSPAPTYSPPPSVPIGSTVGTGSFIRPSGCGKITNWYSAWHRGVDIAQSGGCDIVAIDAGVVTMARWYGSGGLQVMIDHGNGYISLYAHHNSIYVKEGQSVTRGQPIGYMGCTGRCTGQHLHFGLSINGFWGNPVSYIAI